MLVGQKIRVGWNGAKHFTDCSAYNDVRIEAVGIDWVVLRDSEGRAHASGFGDLTHADMKREIES